MPSMVHNGCEFRVIPLTYGAGVNVQMEVDPTYFAFVDFREAAGRIAWDYKIYHQACPLINGTRDELADAVESCVYILAGRYIWNQKHRTNEDVARDEVRAYLEGLE